MKKIMLFLFLWAGCNISFAGNFTITPIVLNFKGIAVSGNITFAYADLGSVLMSRDNNNNWEQKRIFAGGNIVNEFIYGSELTASNDRGEIAAPDDSGENWVVKKIWEILFWLSLNILKDIF